MTAEDLQTEINPDALHTDELLILRQQARKSKDWKLSDEIRDLLDYRNVFVFDTKEGPEVHYMPRSFTGGRQGLEERIQADIRAEKRFDAWLYSARKSIKKQHN